MRTVGFVRRQFSRNASCEIVLAWRSASGSLTLSMWLTLPDRLNTMSACSKSGCTAPLSAMSAMTTSMPVASRKFSRLPPSPVVSESITMTRAPAARSESAKADPMKPKPPVTSAARPEKSAPALDSGLPSMASAVPSIEPLTPDSSGRSSCRAPARASLSGMPRRDISARVSSSAPLRISVFTGDFYPEQVGGQGIYAFEVATRAAALGLEITVVCPLTRERVVYRYPDRVRVQLVDTAPNAVAYTAAIERFRKSVTMHADVV